MSQHSTGSNTIERKPKDSDNQVIFPPIAANNLINIDQIISSVNKELDDIKMDSLSFPIEAMPVRMQKIIHDISSAYGFNKDYLSSAILSACSSAIGATCKVRIKGTWTESAILFMVLIGSPGVNKSAPVTYAYKPSYNRDIENFEDYRKKLIAFKYAESVKNAENAKNATIEKPKRQQSIISDATLEALCSVLSFNKRGIALVMDEIAGLFKNFNRYNKGSDQEFWLSIWSNIVVSINRKNDESILIDNPFLTMIGTIQPTVLNEINKDGRSENGFIDRILFTYPDIKQRPLFNFNEPEESSTQDYHTILNRLFSLEFNEGQSNILELGSKAKHLYQRWSSEQSNFLSSNNNDRLSGIIAKVQVYVFRFSLIYQLLSWACGDGSKYEIEESAMDSAINTAEYFKKMALKVNPINPINNELKLITSKQKQEIYKELPKQFKTSEGLLVSLKYELDERRFKEWLHDETLFTKEKHGIYSKTLSTL